MHRGGGNARITSHNQCFNLIEAFSNLAPWGEKKFVSELKRTYKFKRGVNCHTEDNSPKYRMVGNDVGLESPTYSCNGHSELNSGSINVDKRLRNKCAMTCVEENILSLGGESGCLNEVNYNHERGLKHELINNEPSPEFLSSSQLTKKFNPLTVREGNCFTDTVFSRFTSHFSLKRAGATHVANWNNSRKIAFTLAEVLITLGIIGVVAAMTMPSLIQHHREKAMVTSLEKFVSTISQAVDLYKADNECVDSISTCVSYISKGDENCENFAPIAAKMNVIASVKNANKSTADWLPDKAYNYYGEEQEGIYGGVSKKNVGTCAYLLNDGTTFAVDVNPTNFDIMVDVNGKKLPNRVGQDIFPLLIGADANFVNAGVTSGNSNKNKDVIFYPLGSNYNAFRGLCRYYYSGGCNPLNTDPTKDNGASPTAYVLMTKKLPPKY